MTFLTGLTITALVVGIFWLVSEIWSLKREIEDMHSDIYDYKTKIIGREKYTPTTTIIGSHFKLNTTLDSEIKNLKDLVQDLHAVHGEKIWLLEQYLGIRRLKKEEKIDKYVKVKK